MIRKIFKRKKSNGKIKEFIKKYKIPHEYVLFVTLLIERGQIELATQFLDSLSNSFANDQEIYALYHKLKEYQETHSKK